MIFRFERAFLPLLLVTACDAHSTVGFNDREAPFTAGSACPIASPLGRCENETCVVTDVFDAPSGSITTAVDSDSIFFLRSQQVLGRRSLETGEIEDLVTDLDQLMRMTVDDNYLYWTELDGRIRAVPKQGGTAFDASYVFGNPSELSVDATHVYWVIPEFGEVAMAPKPSGDASQISGQASPQAIAVGTDFVYWVNNGSAGSADGQLVRARRGELSSAEILASNLDSPIAIALGDDAIYFASKQTLYKIAYEGGDPEVLASSFQEIKAIAVYRSTIYGIGQDGMWRLASTGGDPITLDPRPMSALTLACSGVYASVWFEPGFVRYAP